MDFVTLTIVVLVALVLMLLAERELYRRRRIKNEAANVETAPSPLQTTFDQAWGVVQTLSTNARNSSRELMTPEYVKLAPAFRQWVETEIPDDKLRAWLLSLPDEAFNTLTGQVVFFCTDLNIDFRWLLNGILDLQPNTRHIVTNIITSYCHACLEAVQIQDDLNRLHQYQTALNSLEQGSQAEIGQRLLGRLLDANLITPAPPQILMASEQERRQYALKVIQEAAKQDRDKFVEILINVSNTTRRA